LYRYVLLLAFVLVAGCSNQTNAIQKNSSSTIALEQYYFSGIVERINQLGAKLLADGYKVSAPVSYEHEGSTEYSIYSTKEIPRGQIAVEDQKAERYADEFDVGYDGNGVALK
jgi:sialic acid synthase SpsE